MKVLLDENMPHALRYLLIGHEAITSAHQGWNEIRNGILLGKAEAAGFQAVITADQSMSYQQNFTGRSLGLVVLSTNHWPIIKPQMPAVLEALGRCVPGAIIYIEI